MKIHILGVILLAAFASACTINMGTPTDTASANSNQTSSSDDSSDISAEPTANPEKPSAETKTKTAKESESETPEESSEPVLEENEQIQFSKGKTDTTLERTIAPNGSKMFLFNAKKGQTLWFKVTESSNQLDVGFNKNSVQLGEEVRESLNSSGDWAIYISNPTNEPLKYKLWIGIE